MKTTLSMLFALLLVSCLQANGQSSDTALKIISPFDSLSIIKANAIGNKKTGQVTVSLEIKNNYIKEAETILSLSAFGDFGMTDDKGTKYKAYTSGMLGGPDPANNGFSPVSSIHFADKKPGMMGDIVQYLKGGESKDFVFNIKTKTATMLKDFHVTCTLSINELVVGTQKLEVKNFKIKWNE